MKKSQIALLCLTVVVMLSVWFIKSPLLHDDDTVPTGGTPSRLIEITTMRDAIRNERSQEVASLNEIIASSETSIAQKNEALEEKTKISDLTEQEVLMELAIINLGYTDALVHKLEDSVKVLVVCDELSQTQAVEVMNLIYASFAVDDEVIVTYKSVAQLTTS